MQVSMSMYGETPNIVSKQQTILQIKETFGYLMIQYSVSFHAMTFALLFREDICNAITLNR